MRNTIYYFTGTGNSLYIAQQLKKQLEDCQIESMTKEPPKKTNWGSRRKYWFHLPCILLGDAKDSKKIRRKTRHKQRDLRFLHCELWEI